MRNLSIVTINTVDIENYNDENYNNRPGDLQLEGEPLPLSEYGNYIQFPPELTSEQEPEPAPTPELKPFNMQSFMKCQDRQLQRLQKDQSKRILDYRQLRQKLATDTNDMQKQIDEIRAELQRMAEKTAQVEEMRKRVMHCEEQNVQMQIHNDSEFEVLRGVMQHVCGRIERMEELQIVERNYRIQQHQLEQQQLQPQGLQHHQLQQHQQQEHEIDQECQQMEERSSLSAQVSSGTQTHRPRAYSRRTKTTPRAVCPGCHKDLAKNYIQKHLKFNRCGRTYC